MMPKMTPTTETRRHGENKSRRFRPDHPTTRDHLITRSALSCHPERARAKASESRRIYAFLRSGLELLTTTLLEIFDEAAYERFLLRTQMKRSVASYRAFMQEREAATPHKPRCC